MIELVKVKAKIFDSDANVSHQANYNIHFNVITFNEVFRSTKSDNRTPSLEDHSEDVIMEWRYGADPAVTNFENSSEASKAPQVTF